MTTRRNLVLSCWLVGAVVGAVAAGDAAPVDRSMGEWLADARAADAADDAPALVDALRGALTVAPDHPGLEFALARALTAAGRKDEAIDRLEALADAGLEADLLGDERWRALRDRPAFARLADRFASHAVPVVASLPGFRWDEPAFVPEGVAYDEGTGTVFVGSVHLRRIEALTGDGGRRTVAGPEVGLGAVLGLRVDPERHRLWAVSADLPQMRGFVEGGVPSTALFAFDLETFRLVERLAPEGAGPEARLNDLAPLPDGSWVVSDSAQGALYRLPPGSDRLAEWLPPGSFRSPGGLAADDDGSLFVADWSRGLFRVDVAGDRAGAIRKVTGGPGGSLYGIDGLLRRGGDLIAIQNGQRPHGVVRLVLDASRSRVARFVVLERNHPAYDEPTLGALAGDDLLYVANSHWPRFADDGTLPDAGALSRPLILRLPLRTDPP